MTAPLFFVDPSILASAAVGATVRLEGPEGRHAATVQRIGVGETVQLAADGELQAVGEVLATERDCLTVQLTQLRPVPSSAVRFVLVQALAKSGRDEQAVEAAVELGVDAVLPWQANRSIVQWRAERGRKALDKWRQLARAASKQARRPSIPTIEKLADSAAVAQRISRADCAYVLHENAQESIADVPLPESGDVVVVVGPEGGITDEELAAFRAAGGRVVRMGPTVLRSSSAGPAALAVLIAASRWRSSHPSSE